MLLIGGYKRKNADALIDEVIARLDRGEHLSLGVVRDLIKEFKARIAKPKQHEMEPPPDPRTIHDLFELPKKMAITLQPVALCGI